MEGAPPAPDQIAVPAEQGLWPRQQRGQTCSGKQPAEASKQNAITRLPGRLADLALRNTELMAESKHLCSELGVGAGADQHEVDDEEDELVGEAEKHACGTRPASVCQRSAGRPTGQAPRFTPGWPRRCPTELTPGGVRHTTTSAYSPAGHSFER